MRLDAPPAAINDLVVTGYTSTSHTLQWTAPASDVGQTTGQVARYEIRYRSDGQMPTLEDFFTHGVSVAAPVPLIAGQVQTFTVNHPPAGQVLYFRIISRDAAGHDRNWSGLSNEAQTPNGGNGGCPFVDTRTAAGWEVENSILGRSLTGALSLDGYRLRFPPKVTSGRVQQRVRENEQEQTTLDEVRLIAVDHPPGVRAYAVGDRVVMGSRVPAARVTTSAGVDVTAQVNGTGEGFHGGPGDTLLVEFANGAAARMVAENATTTHDPFL